MIHKRFEYSQQSQANSWKLNKDEGHQSLSRDPNREAELLSKNVVIGGPLSPGGIGDRWGATDWWLVFETI